MSSTGTKGAFPLIGDLVNRVPGGPRYARVAAGALVVVLVVLIGFGIARGRRYAAWAPVDVVETRDPLQDLPVRVAGTDGVVSPANTYDAVLDLSSIESLVVGVDLDFIPKGATRYEVLVQAGDGKERFRGVISPHYFDEGRFMLRLFSKRFRSGDYTLEILALDADGRSRVVGSSWFQTTH